MKVKINAISNATLDYAVAMALGHAVYIKKHKILGNHVYFQANGVQFNPSVDWNLGGPALVQNSIAVLDAKALGYDDGWVAHVVAGPEKQDCNVFGDNYLEAGLRCVVFSKLGFEIEVPDELSM